MQDDSGRVLDPPLQYRTPDNEALSQSQESVLNQRTLSSTHSLLGTRYSLLLFIFLLALGLRMGAMAAKSGTLKNFQTGDYDLYRIGAQDFVVNHNFSNSLFMPRPPLFPLMIAALNLNDWAVIVANVVLGALLAPLCYFFARQLGLSHRWALLVALVAALDPTGVLFSPFLGPEPLANLLLLMGIMGALGAVQAADRRKSLLWAILGGLALLLSSLTRPATYLLWIPLGLWLLLAYRRQWLAVGIFTLINLVGVAGWTIHNGQVFKNYSFSSVAPYTMLYYRAAAVEHQATGRDMDNVLTDLNCRVEQRMGRDCANVTADTRYNYHASSPELGDAMNAVSMQVFLAHPLIYVLTIPVGFARMYGLLPELETLGSLPTDLFVAWNAVFLLGALAGLWFAWRRKQWTLFWCALLMGGYFTVGTLLVKSAGMDTRERSMLTPMMATAWAYALAALVEIRKARGSINRQEAQIVKTEGVSDHMGM